MCVNLSWSQQWNFGLVSLSYIKLLLFIIVVTIDIIINNNKQEKNNNDGMFIFALVSSKKSITFTQYNLYGGKTNEKKSIFRETIFYFTI